MAFAFVASPSPHTAAPLPLLRRTTDRVVRCRGKWARFTLGGISHRVRCRFANKVYRVRRGDVLITHLVTIIPRGIWRYRIH